MRKYPGPVRPRCVVYVWRISGVQAGNQGPCWKLSVAPERAGGGSRDDLQAWNSPPPLMDFLFSPEERWGWRLQPTRARGALT